MKTLMLALPLFFACATSVQADQFDPRLDGYFDALYDSQDAKTIRVIERQIWHAWRSTEQSDANDLFQSGMLAMASADFRLAIEQFTDAIALDPDFAEAYNMRATTHFMLGNDFESLTDIETTISLEPRHFGALMGGAQIAIRSGQMDMALGFVEEALEISPHNQGWLSIAERLRDATGAMDL